MRIREQILNEDGEYIPLYRKTHASSVIMGSGNTAQNEIQDMLPHGEASITSVDGVHGFRCVDDELEFRKDNAWTAVPSAKQYIETIKQTLESHTQNQVMHVTPEERRRWDNSSPKVQTTIVIGHASSGHKADEVDYLCSGTSNHTTILNAINQLPQNGGKILLLEGTYTIGGAIDILKEDVEIEGMGSSTLLERNFNGTTTTGIFHIKKSRVKIKNLRISNSAKKTGTTIGILLATTISNIDIEKLIIDEHTYGLRINDSCKYIRIQHNSLSASNSSILAYRTKHCIIKSNSLSGAYGIRYLDFSYYHIVKENIITPTTAGIHCTKLRDSLLTYNQIRGGTYGIYLDDCEVLVISNNFLSLQSTGGIYGGFPNFGHVIHGNVVNSCNNDGIAIGAVYAITSANTINNCKSGLKLRKYALSYGNNISSCTASGIVCEEGLGTICSNSVDTASPTNIMVEGSMGVAIFGNKCRNGTTGIQIDAPTSAVVGNDLWGHATGMRLMTDWILANGNTIHSTTYAARLTGRYCLFSQNVLINKGITNSGTNSTTTGNLTVTV